MPGEDGETAEFLNCATYFLDENLRAGRGGSPALHCAGETVSYQRLCELTNRIGNALEAAGVGLEDRVLLVMRDSPEFVAAFYAVQKIGAGVIVGYVDAPIKEQRYLLELLRPKVVITDAHSIPAMREAARETAWPRVSFVHRLPRSHLGPQELDLEELMAGAAPELETARTHGEDYARWSFTGGSTGFPKVVPASHAGLIHNFASFQEIAGYRADDVILPVPKLYFGYGRTASIIHPFRAGAAAIVFPERSTPEQLFALMNEHQPTVLALVPTAIKKMLAMPKASRPRLERLRLCISGGEALAESLCSAWQEAFGCEVLNMLGSTEMGFVFIANRPGDVVRGSVGKPLRGYEAKIVDADGKMVPDGEEGLLMAKGPSSAQLYWHERAKTQQTFRGEWVCSGDRFRKDADGNFWFAGRNDELVKISGNWVSPAEVEECLLDFPGVRDCAVVAVPSEDGTTQIRACLVLAAGVQAGEGTSHEIRTFVGSRLAPYKAPRIIDYLPELPTTATGKLDRRRLVLTAAGSESGGT